MTTRELIERDIDGCGIYCDPMAVGIEVVMWILILVAGSIFISEALAALRRRLGGRG